MKKNVFFLIGCARSGTTSITKVLNTSNNAEVFVEQAPKLCIASRIQYEFKLPNAKAFIQKSKEDKIMETMKKGLKYGDKNPNYLWFIDELLSAFNCKFIFVIRDGRDAVRSMLEWDKNGKYFYRYFEDIQETNIIQPEDNLWDYSRPRPKQNEELFNNWKKLTKLEKYSWYWNKFNEELYKKTKKLNPNQFRIINMSKTKAKDVENIFNFLELTGYNEKIVTKMLKSRINSVKDRWNKEDKFPNWKNWKPEITKSFDKYAKKMMIKLKYY